MRRFSGFTGTMAVLALLAACATGCGNQTTAVTPTEEAAATEIAVKTAIRPLDYKSSLSIVGDSIASGFGVYGVLDSPYDFATGNLAARSISDYTFDYNGQELSYTGALQQAQPPYIYLSMGMNDVNMSSEEAFVENYSYIINQVISICPNADIIVAGISPIAEYSNFSSNFEIASYNDALEALVNSYNLDRLQFFDTASLLADPNTGCLQPAFDGGDGIHLSQAAYCLLLENLYPQLDKMPTPPVSVF